MYDYLLSWMQVDHFSFANQDNYPQRYLVNSTYWKGNNGPIFFYTGNEGDIEWFAENTVCLLKLIYESEALI